MQEFTAKLDLEALPTLRYTRRYLEERELDIGYACLVGDKVLRIYPNNRVEISDLEYLEREALDEGGLMVSYIERPSWVTQYPHGLALEAVKASLDYAFIHAGLPSLFFMTNLSLVQFDSREEQRLAALSAYRILYPDGKPWITELNAALDQFARDTEGLFPGG